MRKEIAELMKQKMDDAYSNQNFALREMEDAERILNYKTTLLKRATEYMINLEELDCLLNKLG